MYETTLYVLAGALVLLGWSCCRVFPRLPDSGGLRGLRFWLALLLVVALDRVLNTAFFTADVDANGVRHGRLVEYGPTRRIFTAPHDPRTEDYISGRFG